MPIVQNKPFNNFYSEYHQLTCQLFHLSLQKYYKFPQVSPYIMYQ